MYKSLNEQVNSRTTKEMKNKTPKRWVKEEQLEKAERVGMGRKNVLSLELRWHYLIPQGPILFLPIVSIV